MGDMPPLRRRLAAAAALATLLPLTACGDEMPAIRTVPVGDIVEGRTPEQIADGKRSFLMLPVGRLDLRVGELLERIDDDETRDGVGQRAPDGGRLVPSPGDSMPTWSRGSSQCSVRGSRSRSSCRARRAHRPARQAHHGDRRRRAPGLGR